MKKVLKNLYISFIIKNKIKKNSENEMHNQLRDLLFTLHYYNFIVVYRGYLDFTSLNIHYTVYNTGKMEGDVEIAL